jgi:hypothetical protein
MQTAAENDISFISNQPKEVIQRNDVRLVIIISQPTMQVELCLLALGLLIHLLYCNSVVPVVLMVSVKIATEYFPNYSIYLYQILTNTLFVMHLLLSTFLMQIDYQLHQTFIQIHLHYPVMVCHICNHLSKCAIVSNTDTLDNH